MCTSGDRICGGGIHRTDRSITDLVTDRDVAGNRLFRDQINLREEEKRKESKKELRPIGSWRHGLLVFDWKGGGVLVTTKQALQVVDSLRQGWYDPPVWYRNNIHFVQKSYTHSAILEIERYLKEHVNRNPIDAVEDFRGLVGDYACQAKNEMICFMFSVYYDVATDVLDVLIQ